jgi:hypothetical protein
MENKLGVKFLRMDLLLRKIKSGGGGDTKSFLQKGHKFRSS